MAAVAAFMGTAIGLGLWCVSFDLAPDVTGRALVEVPHRLRHALGVLAVGGGGIAAALTWALLPDRAALVGFVIIAASSPALAVIDLVLHRLPFAVTGALAVGIALAFGIDALMQGEAAPIIRSTWGLVAAGALGLVYWRLTGTLGRDRVSTGAASADKAMIGLGDVALFALIGFCLAWLGWPDWWLGLFAGLVLVAATAVIRWSHTGDRWTTLVLGPQLLAGWWTAVVLSSAAAT